ncbi:AraC family transcriptional regulator [Vibrio sp. ZSDZ65]|uniref:AraC family transcriptional regulator n=1 Tax=Vibrio qingdaonensis TaxID=2829491 RepID=A0A9X3CQ19_9VIBR|nr:AraC family transcriptional regulator [Vibrio qingdaonensis]MCW8346440.1 AraC family transcriptional regulator [Vibrio qingdaonensis]
MNHAIEFQSTHYEFLTITPRKKTLHNQLYRIESGKVLLKLGKNEYVYNAGEAFWLPFDCLSSLTILPNTKLSLAKFSVRLSDLFPSQAGRVTLTSLLTALLNKLNEQIDSEIRKDLLQVVRHEVVALHPHLSQSKECKEITEWRPNTTSISGELSLVLLVREARKQKLSGIKKESICEKLFGGSEMQLQSLSLSLLGSEDFSQ